MKEYYEDVWQALGDELALPDLERRLELLRSELRRDELVLDLGCGDGTFTAAIAAAGARPVGVEVAQAALARARARHPGLDFRLAPLDGELPLAEADVDLVWATEVIEHVADTARWLHEIRRVLRPGGRLLITTPNHPRAGILVRGLEHYSEPLGDHLHLYTRRSLADTLRELGFEQVRVQAHGGVPLVRRALTARAVRP
jgi:SAM-dependent methyltransferase